MSSSGWRSGCGLLGADRPLLARAALWAMANWLLSAASLWVFVAAFGYRTDLDGLIVAFGLANVLAAIPLTPGGLGVVEAVLTSALVGFGAPRGTAVLGVVVYRLVNFWLPIPIGGLAYLSLKVGPSVDARGAGGSAGAGDRGVDIDGPDPAAVGPRAGDQAARRLISTEAATPWW